MRELFDREYVKLKKLAAEQRESQENSSMNTEKAAAREMSSTEYAKNSHQLLDEMLADTVTLTKVLSAQMTVLHSHHINVPQKGFSCFQVGKAAVGARSGRMRK